MCSTVISTTRNQTPVVFAWLLNQHIWLVFFCFCLFLWFIYLPCCCASEKVYCSLIGRLNSILSLTLFRCHLVLTVILLRFLLVFICLWFLLHLYTHFLSLFLHSNSIHEKCTLHHSVSLYLCLPFIFSTPFCTGVRWGEEGRKIQRERWTD